jgi:hypothetical protein
MLGWSARRAWFLAFLAILASAFTLNRAAAQSDNYYAGKTLRVLVGVQVGGTADTVVRMFAEYLHRHLAGNPTVLVENMTGAGTNIVFNYLNEKAAPDGLTVVFSAYQALAQALGDQSLRVRFENFEYLGGINDTRVAYMRSDVVPGGAKKPADIVRAPMILVGGYSRSDFESTLSRLSLDVLGVKNKVVVGYRGGSDIFLAMQRNEVQFHNTSIGTFKTRSGTFIASGEGLGVYYLAAVGPDGSFEHNKFMGDVPAFPDLYQEVRGKAPSGETWDALNWLTTQTSGLAYTAFAPKGARPEALAALRGGFAAAASDPDFIAKSVATNSVPYNFVDVERGRAIVRSLAEVSPEVVKSLRAAMSLQN